MFPISSVNVTIVFLKIKDDNIKVTDWVCTVQMVVHHSHTGDKWNTVRDCLWSVQEVYIDYDQSAVQALTIMHKLPEYMKF